MFITCDWYDHCSFLNNYLTIETCRWSNTPFTERFCSYCNLTSNISVIVYFFYDCSLYEDLRKKYLDYPVLVGDV